MTPRWILLLAALLAAIAVALGAYSAHGLEKLLESLGYQADLAEKLEWFETGVRYQMYHALGLLAIALLAGRENSRTALNSAAVAFVLGIVLFSGSLYVMTLAPESWRWLGAVVPFGGVSFILGWCIVAYAAWER